MVSFARPRSVSANRERTMRPAGTLVARRRVGCGVGGADAVRHSRPPGLRVEGLQGRVGDLCEDDDVGTAPVDLGSELVGVGQADVEIQFQHPHRRALPRDRRRRAGQVRQQEEAVGGQPDGQRHDDEPPAGGRKSDDDGDQPEDPAVRGERGRHREELVAGLQVGGEYEQQQRQPGEREHGGHDDAEPVGASRRLARSAFPAAGRRPGSASCWRLHHSSVPFGANGPGRLRAG